MRLSQIGVVVVAAVSVSGCAAMVTAWKNDPLQSYSVKGPSIYAMTGDRRTAVFSNQNSPMKYCAESLPDAVAAVAASSRAAAKYKEAGVDVADTTAVGLLQTFQRTEIAEVSRQLGWNTCLAWAQGAITNAEYQALLAQIVTGSLDVMRTRASQAVPAIAPAGSLVITPAPAPAPSPTPSPSPSPSPSATAKAGGG